MLTITILSLADKFVKHFAILLFVVVASVSEASNAGRDYCVALNYYTVLCGYYYKDYFYLLHSSKASIDKVCCAICEIRAMAVLCKFARLCIALISVISTLLILLLLMMLLLFF